MSSDEIKVPLIDVRPDHWAIVQGILQKHVPQCEVWAFGSRAKWTAKPYSDLDLAVICDQPLSLAVSAALADDLSESDLPWKVDIVDWATTSDSFRLIISQDKVVVQSPNIALMKLEDCMSAIIDYRGKTPKKTDVGIPLVTAKIVKSGRIEEPTEFIAPEDFDAWMTRGLPMAGDVVLTTEAPLGEVAQLDGKKVALAQRIITLRGKHGLLDNTYLKFVLQGEFVQNQLRGRASGSTVSGIKQSELRKVDLPVPAFHEQLAIARVLGSIDDKIELSRRTNATLEAMARAIFKDWFIDFGPVRAKLEGLPPYLAPGIWSLFPDEGDEDGLPVGWTERRIDDVLELAYGKALKSTDRVPGSYPVYGSGGITGFHHQSLVQGPSVIVGRKGTVGSLYWEDRAFFPIDTVFYVKTQAPMTYCYYLLQTLGLQHMNSDAAVPGLNRNNVYRLTHPWPNKPQLINAFDEIVGAIRAQIKENNAERDRLQAIRDLILPKLISGELRISNPHELITETIA